MNANEDVYHLIDGSFHDDENEDNYIDEFEEYGHDLLQDHSHSNIASFPPPPSKKLTDMNIRNYQDKWYKKKFWIYILSFSLIVTLAIISSLIFLNRETVLLSDAGITNLDFYIDQLSFRANYTQNYRISNHNYWPLSIEQLQVVVSFKSETLGVISQSGAKTIEERTNYIWKIPVLLSATDSDTLESIKKYCQEYKYLNLEYKGSYRVQYWYDNEIHNLNEYHKLSCNIK